MAFECDLNGNKTNEQNSNTKNLAVLDEFQSIHLGGRTYIQRKLQCILNVGIFNAIVWVYRFKNDKGNGFREFKH